MKTVMDSVNEITPELLYLKRNRRAVNGRAVASDASAMRERTLVLRLTHREPRGLTLVNRRKTRMP